MVRPCGDQVSLQAFQQAVVDLTLSYPRVRDVREGRDDKWLASYDLTPRERDRIMSIVSQPGMSVHCTLSRGNRLEVVYYAFPMTCVLLGSRLRALVDELWEQHRPTNYQLAGEENAFAEFVGGRIAAAALSIDYLPEILAYETTCLEMTREYRVQRDHHAVIERVVEFRHSPRDLLPPLARLELPPAGLPGGFYVSRVTLREGRFEVDDSFEVSSPDQ